MKNIIRIFEPNDPTEKETETKKSGLDYDAIEKTVNELINSGKFDEEAIKEFKELVPKLKESDKKIKDLYK